MKTRSPLSPPALRRAAALLALSLSSLAAPALAGAGGGGALCADSGHCLFPRWVPGDLVPGAELGSAVSIDGTLAALGAPGADRVYVYQRLAGQWELDDVLESPNGPGADFGASLELVGHRLVVGAPLDDLVGTDAGAAHVYELELGAFVRKQSLTAKDPEDFAHFGRSVATGGNRLAVGEPDTAAGGRVSVYRLLNDQWDLDGLIEEPGAGSLGYAVSLHGNDLLVGDPHDDTLAANAGAVHLVRLTDQVQTVGKVFASDPDPGDQFGISLSFDVDRLVVGAHTDDEQGPNAGAAYVFAKEPFAFFPFYEFVELQKLLPCAAEDFALFGRSVDLDGDRLVVGARGDDTGGAPGGKAYTFRRGGVFWEAWNVEDQIVPPDGTAFDGFGVGVSVHEDHVLVGASGVDQVASLGGAGYFVSLVRDTLGGGACPCDTVASWTPFGTGKPGSAGVPDLSLSAPLVPGESSLIGLDDVLVGSSPLLLWGTGGTALPFDGGTLYVADPFVVPMPTVTAFGQVGLQAVLPDTAAICGLELTLQALLLDPAAGGPFSTAQSRGLRARIGY